MKLKVKNEIETKMKLKNEIEIRKVKVRLKK